MSVVTGVYELADGVPDAGTVTLQPAVTASDLTPTPRVITQGPVTSILDDMGVVSFDVLASDDDGWHLEDSAPMPYLVTERLKSGYRSYAVVLMGPGPHDLAALQPIQDVDVAPYPVPGPVGPVGPPGPQGVQGVQGEVSVASTVTGAPGTSAIVVDNDASPNRAVLEFTIPRGDVGATGPKGDTGPMGAGAATIGNLLTENQASGTDTLGDTTGFWPNLVTLASTAVTPIHGAKSLQVTFTGAGAAGFYLQDSASTTSGRPIGEGTYTMRCSVTATAGETFALVAVFFTAAGAAIPATIYSPTFVGAGAEQQVTHTFVAPAGAGWLQFYLRRATGAAGSVWKVDRFGYWKGAGGDWAMPGTPITGLQSSMEQVTLWADLPLGNWLGRRIQVTSGLGFCVALWNGTAWTVAPESDTGNQNIAALLKNGWVVTAADPQFTIRRTGNLITINASLNGSAQTNMILATLPAGWRTYQRISWAGNAGAATLVAGDILMTSSPGDIRGFGANTLQRFTSLYPTNDAWPTTPPA